MRSEADIYIRNSEAKGFPVTAQQGIGVASNRYVAVLNNDIKFFGDWVTPLLDLLMEPNVGLVHPKMLDWGQPVDNSHNLKINPPPQQGMFFSAFVVDKNMYEAIGGWDTDYDFWGYDDWDYYYRMLLSGQDAIWTDEVVYWHKGGATISRIGRDKFAEKNRELFKEKHGIDPHGIDWSGFYKEVSDSEI